MHTRGAARRMSLSIRKKVLIVGILDIRKTSICDFMSFFFPCFELIFINTFENALGIISKGDIKIVISDTYDSDMAIAWENPEWMAYMPFFRDHKMKWLMWNTQCNQILCIGPWISIPYIAPIFDIKDMIESLNDLPYNEFIFKYSLTKNDEVIINSLEKKIINTLWKQREKKVNLSSSAAKSISRYKRIIMSKLSLKSNASFYFAINQHVLYLGYKHEQMWHELTS